MEQGLTNHCHFIVDFFGSKLNNMSFSIVHNVTDVFAKCRVLWAYFIENNKYNNIIP